MNPREKLIHLATIHQVFESAQLLVELGLIDGPAHRYVKKYTTDRPHVQRMFDDENTFGDMEAASKDEITPGEVAKTVGKTRPTQRRW